MTVSDDELIARLEKAAKPSEFRRRNPTLSDTAMAMRHTFEGALFTEAAARIRSLFESKREAVEANAELRRQSTDRSYMMDAYRNMLGPIGLEVAKMWADRNVKRVHFSWGHTAADLTGEERAQTILDWEAAPRHEVSDREIDGDDPTPARAVIAKEAGHAE